MIKQEHLYFYSNNDTLADICAGMQKMGYLMCVVYAKTTDIYFNVKYNGENADIDQC